MLNIASTPEEIEKTINEINQEFEYGDLSPHISREKVTGQPNYVIFHGFHAGANDSRLSVREAAVAAQRVHKALLEKGGVPVYKNWDEWLPE